jgi:hypothetical protein
MPPPPPPGSSTWRDLSAGIRVVVRRRLSPAEAAASGHVWTDVIGVVLAVDDAGLRLRRDPARRAAVGDAAEPDVVVVPGAEIEAVRRLPPRPARRPRAR